MKYVLEATKDFETVVPESKVVYHTIHGVKHSEDTLPERRYVTKQGTRTVVRRKADVTRLLKTGNWTLASMP